MGGCGTDGRATLCLACSVHGLIPCAVCRIFCRLLFTSDLTSEASRNMLQEVWALATSGSVSSEAMVRTCGVSAAPVCCGATRAASRALTAVLAPFLKKNRTAPSSRSSGAPTFPADQKSKCSRHRGPAWVVLVCLNLYHSIRYMPSIVQCLKVSGVGRS